jgi:CRISPR-associated protein Csm4
MSKQYRIVRLENFKGGLHLARGLTNTYDKSLKTLHSDTIKSAIFVCALELFPEIGVAGEQSEYQAGKYFLGQFKVSSAFPFIDQDYYFPTIEIPRPYNFSEDASLTDKEKKKILYLRQDVFKEYIKDIRNFKLTKEHLTSKSVLDKKRYGENIKSDTYQHVAVSRDYGSDSDPYYVDKIYFEKNAGLYFLLEMKDEEDTETLKKIEAALKLLGDNGIGTDRNTGNGQFDMDMTETMTFDVSDDATHDLVLSLYCPKKVEIDNQLKSSYYNLIKRGGYISSPQNEVNLTIRKRSIHFFAAGSVFPKYENRSGTIVNLQPDFSNLKHPIWRDGRPIILPIKYETDEK